MANLVNYTFDSNMSFSKFLNKSPGVWMENKRKADKNDGLWRIHNGLYDVTDFITVHPGGKFWLQETKGMDITEAFESHHVMSDIPERMLKRFYIRDAEHPRLSRLTFHDDEFYRTVKRRVREVLKTIPSKHKRTTNMYTDIFLLLTFITAIFANYHSMYIFAIIAGIFGGATVVASHNYYHMRDNFRMFYADILLLPSRDARIIHVLSHHMYTNTIADIQLNIGQPWANFFPQSKTFLVKYFSWFYTPLLLWPLLFYVIQLLSFLEYHVTKVNRLSKATLLPLILPFTMFVLGGQSLLTTFLMWNVLILTSTFILSMLAFTTNHIHPTVYVEGDVTRPNEELDWGINQLDTVKDRHEVTGNKFLVLIAFGDHALHHLFPTIDHGILHHLYPVVEETLKEFNIASIRMTTQAELFFGYFQRLAHEIPNSNPACLGYIQK